MTQAKGAVTPQETEPDLLLVLEGLPWRVVWQWLAMGTGAWEQESLKVPLGISPLGGHH